MRQYNLNLKTYWSKREKVREMLKMEDRYRTCCNCWHIRTGTAMLGVIELVAVSVILSGIIRQLKWKTVKESICKKRWRNCVNIEDFNLTLIGDYVIAFSLISIAICIVLLFYGIVTAKSRFLLPHLIVQAIGLIFSFGYFFLYAWSYFYGDLYIQHKKFVFEYFVEKIWLSAIILVFAVFQSYLLITVVKCSLYLNKLKMEQHRRFMQYEEVSNRVRLAKENGLWRSTSWGGGFQQYRGQYEKRERKKASPEEKKSNNNRVQWNLEKNLEKSISCGRDDSTNTSERVQQCEPNKKSTQPSEVQITRMHSSNSESRNSPLLNKKSNSARRKNSNSFSISSSTGSKTRKNSEEDRSQKELMNSRQGKHPKGNQVSDNIKINNIRKISTSSASATAVIYTKITANPKFVPKATLRFQAMKCLTFDNETSNVDKPKLLKESLPKSSSLKELPKKRYETLGSNKLYSNNQHYSRV